jgi:hypothetical protein
MGVVVPQSVESVRRLLLLTGLTPKEIDEMHEGLKLDVGRTTSHQPYMMM